MIILRLLSCTLKISSVFSSAVVKGSWFLVALTQESTKNLSDCTHPQLYEINIHPYKYYVRIPTDVEGRSNAV